MLQFVTTPQVFEFIKKKKKYLYQNLSNLFLVNGITTKTFDEFRTQNSLHYKALNFTGY